MVSTYLTLCFKALSMVMLYLWYFPSVSVQVSYFISSIYWGILIFVGSHLVATDNTFFFFFTQVPAQNAKGVTVVNALMLNCPKHFLSQKWSWWSQSSKSFPSGIFPLCKLFPYLGHIYLECLPSVFTLVMLGSLFIIGIYGINVICDYHSVYFDVYLIS